MKRLATLVLFSLLWLSGCTTHAPPPRCTPTETLAEATPVCFTTTDGWFLQGVEWNAGATNTTPVLLVHGLNENRHSYDALARDLAANGSRVLAFDSRGHGKSVQRTDGFTKTLAQFEEADAASMERDLDPIVTYLGRLRGIGASIGANELLRKAAAGNGIERVALLSPGLDYHGLTTSDAARHFPGPAFFMASAEDAYPAQSARQLADLHQGPDQLRIWNGKGHGTQMLDAETRNVIAAWIQQS